MTDNPTKFHRRGSQTVATYKEQSQTQTNKQTNHKPSSPLIPAKSRKRAQRMRVT
jgi:hypothetical protein